MPLAKLSTAEQARIRRAFQTLTGEEATLLWNILAMHVENERCNDEVENPEEAPEFKVAENLLERVEVALVQGV